MAASLAFFISCSSEDDAAPGTQVSVSGSVLITFAGQPVTNTFASYFADGTPSGGVNNSMGTSYENFFIRDKYKEFFYSAAFGSSNGFSKVFIDENGVAQEAGTISSTGVATSIIVVNDEQGYYHDRNSVDLIEFNPTTMERLGTIDMSNSFQVEGVELITYGVPVIRGDKMFVVAYNTIQGNYATDSVIVHVIDRTTNQFEKSIAKNGHVSPLPARLDTNGDIYIGTQGNISIPNTFKPSFIRIPAGSTEFDDYEFFPIDVLPQGPSLPAQAMTRWHYTSTGQALALGGVSVPSTILSIFAEKPNFAEWTQEDITKALEALNTEAAGAWLEIDFNAKTVSQLSGLPLSAPFTGVSIDSDGENVHFSIQSPSTNAVYNYNIQSKEVSKLFDITDGTFFSGLYDLEAEDGGPF
ncbi:MAG: hypothetical protein AAF843_13730 [Bacteroidota bacterium]